MNQLPIMNRMTFITGVALLVVAATLAITITLRPPPAKLTGDSVPQGSRAREIPAQDRGAFHEQRTAVRRSERPSVQTEQQWFSVAVPEEHPERPTLVAKAAKVESYAVRRIEELDRQLDLSLDQQRRLFPILARSSENYDSAMRISGIAPGTPSLIAAVRTPASAAGAGTPAPAAAAAELALAAAAVEAAIQGELDPKQQDERIEISVNDMALWEEIIDGLQRKLEEQTPRVSASEPALEPDTEAAKPSGESGSPARGNLFDLVEPNQ
jgi:hypothetical protein